MYVGARARASRARASALAWWLFREGARALALRDPVHPGFPALRGKALRGIFVALCTRAPKLQRKSRAKRAGISVALRARVARAPPMRWQGDGCVAGLSEAASRALRQVPPAAC